MSNGFNRIKKSRKIISDILTLSYPKYRLITFLVVLFLLFITPISLLETLPNLSICSHVLGEYCYSVGTTRGVSSLLKGNISQAIEYNPLSVPVLFVLSLIVVFDVARVFSEKNYNQES